jgi:hypothetical protein
MGGAAASLSAQSPGHTETANRFRLSSAAHPGFGRIWPAIRRAGTNAVRDQPATV